MNNDFAARLSLKLGLRRYFLKQDNKTRPRSWVLHHYHMAPVELIDAVLEECVAEGTVTVSSGPRGGVIYTWHEDSIVPMEASRG